MGFATRTGFWWQEWGLNSVGKDSTQSRALITPYYFSKIWSSSSTPGSQSHSSCTVQILMYLQSFTTSGTLPVILVHLSIALFPAGNDLYWAMKRVIWKNNENLVTLTPYKIIPKTPLPYQIIPANKPPVAAETLWNSRTSPDQRVVRV